jgi:hypothetical protein
MPKYETATIYLLEDINDNRYVGSTGEQVLEHRLHTHRRDYKEHMFKKRIRHCSSMKLNLYNCVIIELKKVKNDKDTRKYWESHYINNVYPECINTNRLNFDSVKFSKEYYAKNKNKIIKRNTIWRQNNREAYNAQRREYYAKNKEKICQQKRKQYIRSKLKKKNINNSNNEDP